MTRWARSKSSQRHEKLPLDPTPWAEFALQNSPKNKNIPHNSNPSTQTLDGNIRNANNKLRGKNKIGKCKNKSMQKINEIKNGNSPAKASDLPVAQMRSINENTKYKTNIETPALSTNNDFSNRNENLLVKSYQCASLNAENNTKKTKNNDVEIDYVTSKNLKKKKKRMLINTGNNSEDLHLAPVETIKYGTKSNANIGLHRLFDDHCTSLNAESSAEEVRNNAVESDHASSKDIKKLLKKWKRKILISTGSDSEDLDMTQIRTMIHNTKSSIILPKPSNNSSDFSYRNKNNDMLLVENQCTLINVENSTREPRNNPIESDHSILENAKKIKKKRKSMVIDTKSESKNLYPKKQKSSEKVKKITNKSVEELSSKEILKEAETEIDEGETLQSSDNESCCSDVIKQADEGRVKKKNIDGKKKYPGQAKNKLRWLNKVKENRKQNGILLLPDKVEQKLYRVRKLLKDKGMPGKHIKEIMRKKRRREELQYRKIFSNQKACFKCRQTDHLLADCPVVMADNEQGIGICFKCGSTEHISRRCTLKTAGFPFAKCFICQQQGHLTRNCPENKHGVYPKGGKCNLCGAIDHLKRECPTLEKESEPSITAHVMSGMTSMDAEILDSETKKMMPKGPKVVKF